MIEVKRICVNCIYYSSSYNYIMEEYNRSCDKSGKKVATNDICKRFIPKNAFDFLKDRLREKGLNFTEFKELIRLKDAIDARTSTSG